MPPSQSDIALRMAMYSLLGSVNRKPDQAELRLTGDGWEIWGGEVAEPVAVHVDLAYEASGFDQAVLDRTRELCGTLRIRAKRDRIAAEQLSDLREGLARARKMKAARA